MTLLSLSKPPKVVGLQLLGMMFQHNGETMTATQTETTIAPTFSPALEVEFTNFHKVIGDYNDGKYKLVVVGGNWIQEEMGKTAGPAAAGAMFRKCVSAVKARYVEIRLMDGNEPSTVSREGNEIENLYEWALVKGNSVAMDFINDPDNSKTRSLSGVMKLIRASEGIVAKKRNPAPEGTNANPDAPVVPAVTAPAVAEAPAITAPAPSTTIPHTTEQAAALARMEAGNAEIQAQSAAAISAEALFATASEAIAILRAMGTDAAQGFLRDLAAAIVEPM
jgi:hypothetical protein